MSGFSLIKPGMIKGDVVKLLGEPDETYTLSPNIKNKKSPYVYNYLLQRLMKNGTNKERKEKFLDISFSTNNQVVYKRIVE